MLKALYMMEKENKKLKVTACILASLVVGCVYIISGNKKQVQMLKNENLNLEDMNRGQEETIRSLCYGLGKLKNKISNRRIWKRV